MPDRFWILYFKPLAFLDIMTRCPIMEDSFEARASFVSVIRPYPMDSLGEQTLVAYEETREQQLVEEIHKIPLDLKEIPLDGVE
ncbi:unnamed protein product [Vicia faba]|uniref:Uncharacterized protein n=1 Tax=Vicia faba TaxID=3906 RepID=A0AAV0ZC59_VICFA|nr:unnamed protein product [Vicia faba]